MNLSLTVRGVREDGYHLLESVVVPVSLFDKVQLRLTDDPKIDVHVSHDGFAEFVPEGERNLAYRAASAFLDACPARLRPIGVEISLSKFIPVGAGLGGGSSDAAAVLHTLNRLLGNPLPDSRLALLGAQLGADVPFSLLGQPAIVSGIGEIVRPFTLRASVHLVLCYDGIPLLTSEVFRAWDVALTENRLVSRIDLRCREGKTMPSVGHNDLEQVAEMLRPEIGRMKRMLLEAGVSQVSMSGSGSTVFGICQSACEARLVARKLRLAGYWAEAVRVLPRAWAFH